MDLNAPMNSCAMNFPSNTSAVLVPATVSSLSTTAVEAEATHITSTASACIYNHGTGTLLEDAMGNSISVDSYLGTKPLRGDLSTRPGPGGRKLTYMSGDVVTRTLNEAFGHDGWSFSVLSTALQHTINLNETDQDKAKASTTSSTHHHNTNNKPQKWQVTYIAHVRITLVGTPGCFREDCGIGDSIDKHLPTAMGNALKASITDGMKRAARLLGDKMGNSLYDSAFTINKAPGTFGQALQEFRKERQDWQRKILSTGAKSADRSQVLQQQKRQTMVPTPQPTCPVEQKPKEDNVRSNVTASAHPPPQRMVSMPQQDPNTRLVQPPVSHCHNQPISHGSSSVVPVNKMALCDRQQANATRSSIEQGNSNASFPDEKRTHVPCISDTQQNQQFLESRHQNQVGVQPHPNSTAATNAKKRNAYQMAASSCSSDVDQNMAIASGRHSSTTMKQSYRQNTTTPAVANGGAQPKGGIDSAEKHSTGATKYGSARMVAREQQFLTSADSSSNNLKSTSTERPPARVSDVAPGHCAPTDVQAPFCGDGVTVVTLPAGNNDDLSEAARWGQRPSTATGSTRSVTNKKQKVTTNPYHQGQGVRAEH